MIIYKVCDDCIMAIANDDYSGLDYYLSEDESLQRMEQIKQGMAALGQNIVCMNDEPDEFSVVSCDCCGDHLAGRRHYVADITEELK